LKKEGKRFLFWKKEERWEKGLCYYWVCSWESELQALRIACKYRKSRKGNEKDFAEGDDNLK